MHCYCRIYPTLSTQKLTEFRQEQKKPRRASQTSSSMRNLGSRTSRWDDGVKCQVRIAALESESPYHMLVIIQENPSQARDPRRLDDVEAALHVAGIQLGAGSTDLPERGEEMTLAISSLRIENRKISEDESRRGLGVRRTAPHVALDLRWLRRGSGGRAWSPS